VQRADALSLEKRLVRRAREACVRGGGSCAEGMRAGVSAILFWVATDAKLTIKAGAGPKYHAEAHNLAQR